MTNAISFGLPTPTSGPGQTATTGSGDASPMGQFLAMLDALLGGGTDAAAPIAAAPPGLAGLSGIDGAPRSEEGDPLADLLAALDGLAQGFSEGAFIDPEALEQVEAAIVELTALVQRIAPELAPGADAAEPDPALDALLARLAQLSDALSAPAPDLAAKLGAFQRALEALKPQGKVPAESGAKAEGEPLGRMLGLDARVDAGATFKSPPPGAEAAADPVDRRPDRSIGAQNLATAAATAAAARPPAASAGPAETAHQHPDILAPGAAGPDQAQPAPQAARAVPVAYQRPEVQINLPHIAVEIARHLQNGINRFEIRLNPPELGRIDVRMEMDPSGNVTARLAVERAETLDLLQRDQRTLERALAQVGLDSGKTSLEFSLDREGFAGSGDADDNDRSRSGTPAPATADAATDPALPLAYRTYVRPDAVNLWV